MSQTSQETIAHKLDYLHSEAVQKHKKGQLEEAVAFYLESIEVDENQPAWIYGNVISLLVQLDISDKASALGEKALKIHPKSDEVYIAISILCRNKGQIEESITYYQKAIQINQDQPEWVYIKLLDYLVEQNLVTEAIEYAQKGIKLYPDSEWINYNLGQALAAQSKWQEAMGIYCNLLGGKFDSLKVTSKIQEALYALIQPNYIKNAFYLYQKTTEKQQTQIESYRKTLSQQPDSQELCLKLGNALIDQGKIDEAVEIYARLLGKQSKRVNAQLLLTKILNIIQKKLNIDKEEILLSDINFLQDDHKVFNLIRESGLFDSLYYLAKNQHIAHLSLNPLEHYINEGSSAGTNPNPFFDTQYYLAKNPDVATSGINPLAHYIAFGAKEGRVPWSIDKLALEFKKTNLDIFQEEYPRFLREPNYQFSGNKTKNTIGIYSSSLGNYFINEIADFLNVAFQLRGYDTYRLSEVDKIPSKLDYHLIVAPHEFFYLGEGKSRTDLSLLSNGIMVNVEQPHTSWFSKSLHYLKQARLVFDINLQSAAMLEKMGITAYFLPLGFQSKYENFEACSNLPHHLLLNSLPNNIRNNIASRDAPLEFRPLDLHFIGILNHKRETFFAENACWLSKYRCFWHIPPLEGPLIKEEDRTLDSHSAIGLSRLSKILLNIHRNDLPYFEWHRIVFHGLWQKTLVVSEPCYRIPGLIPNEHYIECELQEVAERVDWLLNTSAGRETAEQIRHAGYKVLQNKFDMQKIMTQVSELLVNCY